MIDNRDKEDKEIEAISLIDRAENFADQGKGDDAIQLYEKAAQIYLDLGSYIKIDELFIKISKIIARFKNNIQAVYRLKSIITKTEELKLNEISAKLLIQLGNVSFNMKDWETAGECWEKAADYLYEVDPEEFRDSASILLLKAGQVYERSRIKKDLGKRLIFRAVMKINKFDEIYQIEEKKGLTLIEMKEFKEAADKFSEIANYFRKSLKDLDDLLDGKDSKDTLLHAKARFIHFVAEYQTVAALCLRTSENITFNEKIKELGYDALELFKKAISLLKQYLIKNRVEYDKEILLRITFDTMLLSIVQEMLGINQVNSIEFLLENLEEHGNLTKKLKKTPYFKITERIEKLGLRETLDKLLKVHLGHFEKIKRSLILHFKTL